MIKNFIKLVGKKIKSVARTSKGRKRDLGLHEKRDLHKEKDAFAVSSEQSSQELHIEPPHKKVQKRPGRKKSQPAPRPKWNLDQFEVPPVEGKSRFHDFPLPLSLMRAIADLEFSYCTPIQEKSLPVSLQGTDLVGRAQTGTGKSAAFLISIFSQLLNNRPSHKRAPGQPRALIIMPTRELVQQIIHDARGLAKYTNLRIQPVFGGVDYQKQKEMVQQRPIDLLAATPGRLLDFTRQRAIRLDKIEILVLDEADRMLDMGFIPDVRRIVSQLPAKEKRQTLMFSATITDEVKRLASQWCQKPQTIEIEPEQVAVDTVQQIIYLTTSKEKYTVLYNLLVKQKLDRVMVFTNRKDEARKLTDRLKRNGINCAMLSGDVQQKQRTSRLEGFRAGKIKVLVATDVAGRGIHIEGISHVVNYTLPYEPEDYVHRIGRTGRAGTSGTSISFACDEGGFYLPEIEAFIGRKLECEMPEEALLEPPPKGTVSKEKEKKQYSKRPRRTGPPKKHAYKGGGNRPPRNRGPKRRKPSSTKQDTKDT